MTLFDSDKGLYDKYLIVKKVDGTVITDCFILRPEKDPAAVVALQAYAAVTPNKALADDLYKWVGKPMQKPLTLQEAIDLKDITYLEIKRKTDDGEKVYVFPIGIDETNHNFYQMTAYYVIGRSSGNYLDNSGYNVYWRCWKHHPTDEERAAAPWEV